MHGSIVRCDSNLPATINTLRDVLEGEAFSSALAKGCRWMRERLSAKLRPVYCTGPTFGDYRRFSDTNTNMLCRIQLEAA